MSDQRPQGQPDEAMVDLAIKQVTEGLSPDEQRALDAMDSETASAFLRDFERAAAAVTLAGGAGQAPLPAALSARIAQQAAEHFASAGKVTDLAAVRATAADKARHDREAAPRRAARVGAYGWIGWFAAAACLVLAIWERSAPPTAAEERAALLAKADSLKIPLGATKDPAAAGVTGDVVWDPATQRGFLHFAGLPPNDPAVHQYQIWIFDAGRDKRYPVDGGVFDVPANAGEVVIPIRASLMVRKPAAFAVTLEKPSPARTRAHRNHMPARPDSKLQHHGLSVLRERPQAMQAAQIHSA
jgi:Anti-sigma-K factor rskA